MAIKIRSIRYKSNHDAGLYMPGEANFDLQAKVANNSISTITKITAVIKNIFRKKD